MSMKLQRYKTYENVEQDQEEKCDLLMSMAAQREPELENWPAFHALAWMYMNRFVLDLNLNAMADKFVEVYNKKKDKFWFGKDKLKEYEAITDKHEVGIAFQSDANNWVGIFDVDKSQYNRNSTNRKGPGYYKGPDMDQACKTALGYF